MADAPKPDPKKEAETVQEEDEEEEDRGPLVSGRENPAIYTDSFFMTYWPDKMRISFSESIRGRIGLFEWLGD
jgi:hypothetical protein